MKFFIFVALVVIWGSPVRAESVAPAVAVPVVPVVSLEEDIVKSMMVFCLPPIIKNFDPSSMATMFKLPEMPAENALLFDPQGGRVFGSPNYPDNILIIAGKNGACSVVARDFNPTSFWVEVDKTRHHDRSAGPEPYKRLLLAIQIYDDVVTFLHEGAREP